MRQDVVGDDARRLNRMYARLHRQAREHGIHFRDRVQAHKSLVPSRGDAQQCRSGLRVVRMALLGGGNENCRIEENVHWLRLQNGLNPLLAHVLKDALPVCPWFCGALMDPQTIDLGHGRPLFDPLEKHAFRLLNSFQFGVRLEAQPLPERLGDDDPSRFIDPEVHAIVDTICHLKWQIMEGS